MNDLSKSAIFPKGEKATSDYFTDLDDIQEAYAAMDERSAIKSLLRDSEL